jgi:hypothetical protein
MRASVLTIQGDGGGAIELIGQLRGLTGARYDTNGQPTGDEGLLPAGGCKNLGIGQS